VDSADDGSRSNRGGGRAPDSPNAPSLWRHGDFLKLWVGQTISIFGTYLSAFQLVAVLTVGATPAQIALLNGLRQAPGPLVGLAAGLWADRRRRRPLMIGADLGRALLVGSLPVAALLGLLRIEHFYVVGLLAGLLTVLFEVAYRAYLPSLVRREQLVEANSKLQTSDSAAEATGSSISGALIQVLGAPVTLVIDALSFLASAVSLLLIRAPEPSPRPSPDAAGAPPDVRRELAEGLRLLWRDPVLRASAGATGTLHLRYGIVGVVILLYWVNDLGLTPLLMGLIGGVGGVVSVLAALLAGRLTRRWGLGPVLIGGLALSGVTGLLLPLAAGPLPLIVGLLMLAQLGDGAHTIAGITETSLIQAVTPGHLLGRVHGGLRVVQWTAELVGLIAGGLLGELIGLRPTVAVGVGVGLLLPLWFILSPVRTMRAQPR
jgi:MFS family permease